MASSSSSNGRVVWNHGDSDDEELENSMTYKNAGKVAVILVIDSTPNMFQQWGENEDTPFLAALKCCHSLWRSKIVSSPRDLVGILLVGTEKDRNAPGFPNLFLLQPLSTLKATMIEELNRMLSSDDLDGFEDRIGSSSKNNLKDLFWLSKIIFEDAKAGTFAKKLIYFTCEDNPHVGNRNLRNDSIQKFKDLGPIDFSVVAFSTDFQYGNFYKNLLPDESSITFPKDLKNLMQVVRMREKAKRPMCRTSLQIAPGVSVAVGVYSLARSALPPYQISVNERTNEVVTKTVNAFRADTGFPVLKSEQMKVANLLGETVRFEKDELRSMKDSVETGVFVLGYLPRSTLDVFTSFRSDGYFIYPDEQRITGSTDLFSTLLRRCHALEKVALVKMFLTRGRTAKLAILIPSVEGAASGSGSLVPNKRNNPPCGFYVFLLPFSDEMRAPEIIFGRSASDELVELMERIIRKTSNKNFDLYSVQNPTLQHKWRQIERIALNQGEGDAFAEEEFMDYTEPNDVAMHTRVASICEQVEEEVASTGGGQQLSISVPAKKPINMAMEVKNKRVEKLTRNVIADFLESQGINTARKTKPQVVELLYSYFGEG